MKFLVVLAVAVACASAVEEPIYRSPEYNAGIVRTEYDIQPEGSFSYGYETENGISAQAVGKVVNYAEGNPAITIEGSSRYISPEGTPVELTYTADENGYRPYGAHLPVAPEIPEPILRALRYITEHPAIVKVVEPKKQL